MICNHSMKREFKVERKLNNNIFQKKIKQFLKTYHKNDETIIEVISYFHLYFTNILQ